MSVIVSWKPWNKICILGPYFIVVFWNRVALINLRWTWFHVLALDLDFLLSVSNITVPEEMSHQINAVSSYPVLINYKAHWLKIWSGLWHTKLKSSWLKYIWKTQHRRVSLYFQFQLSAEIGGNPLPFCLIILLSTE